MTFSDKFVAGAATHEFFNVTYKLRVRNSVQALSTSQRNCEREMHCSYIRTAQTYQILSTTDW